MTHEGTHTAPEGTRLWIDASAGVAGDMLLAALLDAGAPAAAVETAVDAVIPGEVELRTGPVRRAGLRALRLEVIATAADHPHRSWATIRSRLADAALDPAVRASAQAVFARLAAAEGRVHGVPAEQVHFHEVGSWDSIADIVGVCAAVHALGVREVLVGPVALGSGRIPSAHGDLPVPAPAVLELATGWPVTAGGAGELATPTGMALVTTLAGSSGPLPAMVVHAVGVGAGGRDVPGRANVTRVVLGRDEPVAGTTGAPAEQLWVLETNVDDLDPRLWPGVLTGLLELGAADAWLVPILMKKGRPAHSLCVLAADADRPALREAIFASTTTLGVRERPVLRTALARRWVDVPVAGRTVRIKIGLQGGVVRQATPEFEDAAALAADRGLPVRDVLDEAAAAARRAGLWPGADEPGHPGAPV